MKRVNWNLGLIIIMLSTVALTPSCSDDDNQGEHTAEDCPLMHEEYGSCSCDEIGRIQWGEHTCFPEIEGEAFIGTPACGCGVEMIIEMFNRPGDLPLMSLYLKDGLVNKALADQGAEVTTRRHIFFNSAVYALNFVGPTSHDYYVSLWTEPGGGYRCHINDQFGWNTWVDFGLRYQPGMDELEGTMYLIGDPASLPADWPTSDIERCDFVFSRLQ